MTAGKAVAAAAALAALVLLPVGGSAYFTDFVFTMMIAYVLAQSWDWIGGEAGCINLAHYVFFGVGAYGFCLSLVAGVPIALCFVVALAVTSALALVLAFPLFRLRGDSFISALSSLRYISFRIHPI